ncbi:hypothetical protein D4L85_08450 [Chryseolinea soli]|uniref:DUF6089 domain-containing protein n=2 Tax=Chryseolinea soli TaxID=2321403 RepID=A0A385SI68_9BACT|nr:hypothetical protein D4L85_08450 [Chryseolinea soli]
MSRRNIKKNNKRISTFRGRKAWFAKEKVYNAIGFSVSALNYYGDLAPRPSKFSTDISFTKPALAFSFSHRFGPRYTLTAAFMYGTLKGSDAESADKNDTGNGVFRYQRNLSFRNRIKEFSVIGTFDLFPNSATYISRVKWTPYAFVGVAVFLHNPQAQAPAVDPQGNPLPEAGKWVDLQPLGTEGQYATLQEGDANYGIKPYKKIQPAIPFGIGARFRLNEVMDLAAEIGFRYTFTDYLDDVSKNYVDLGVFQGNQLAKAMSYRSSEVATPGTTYVGRDGGTYTVVSGYGQEFPDNVRGNKNNRDIYMVTTVRVTYILGKNFHRAKFR